MKVTPNLWMTISCLAANLCSTCEVSSLIWNNRGRIALTTLTWSYHCQPPTLRRRKTIGNNCETCCTPQPVFTGREFFPRAGEIIATETREADQYRNDPERHQYVRDLNRFLTKHSYALVESFIENKVRKCAIIDCFRKLLGREDKSVSSTYRLRQKVSQLYE